MAPAPPEELRIQLDRTLDERLRERKVGDGDHVVLARVDVRAPGIADPEQHLGVLFRIVELVLEPLLERLETGGVGLFETLVLEREAMLREVARSEVHVARPRHLHVGLGVVVLALKLFDAILDPPVRVGRVEAHRVHDDDLVLRNDAQQALHLHDVAGHGLARELVVPVLLERRSGALKETGRAVRRHLGQVARRQRKRRNDGERQRERTEHIPTHAAWYLGSPGSVNRSGPSVGELGRDSPGLG